MPSTVLVDVLRILPSPRVGGFSLLPYHIFFSALDATCTHTWRATRITLRGYPGEISLQYASTLTLAAYPPNFAGSKPY